MRMSIRLFRPARTAFSYQHAPTLVDRARPRTSVRVYEGMHAFEHELERMYARVSAVYMRTNQRSCSDLQSRRHFLQPSPLSDSPSKRPNT